MALKGLDLAKTEQGIGRSNIETVQGDPFLASPTRIAVAAARTTIGNADGYDVSSATAIRLYYDVRLAGASTFVDIYLVPIASDAGRGNVPVPKTPNGDFDPDVPVFDQTSGTLQPQSAKLRITATRRGSLTLPRFNQSFKVQVETDAADAGTDIALAMQSIQAGGE